MLKKNNNIFLIFILFIVSAVLISAFIIQYGLGYSPCKLCLYERIPYILSIFLILKTLFFKKYRKITLFILSLVFIASAALAFYHFGIEQGFFSELNICGANSFSNTLTKTEILEQLNRTAVSCKNVDFSILGLSLASINSILSLVLSAIFIKLFFNYEKNK